MVVTDVVTLVVTFGPGGGRAARQGLQGGHPAPGWG